MIINKSYNLYLLKFLLGLIIKITIDNMYKIGTKKRHYCTTIFSRNQFAAFNKENYVLHIKNIFTGKISPRAPNTKESMLNKQ